LPIYIQQKLFNLIEDLIEKGPIRSDWPNYSKLSENEYHCHLARKWVACWFHEKNTLTIEVYYAGSREKAPY
ncbi:MAG: hypothetical protein JW982_02510, partial [Spirochaetes bacterium]|nr:hypothetical protein [Spirochaetota bacterium]